MKRSILYIIAIIMAMAANAADYRLKIDNFSIKAGETTTVNLDMINVGAITGFQTDIVLPEGLSIEIDENNYYCVNLTTRATHNHTIDANTVKNNTVRIMSYTTDLNPFKENSGAVATIKMKASEDFSGEQHLVIRNTEFTSPTGQTYKPANEVCWVSGGNPAPIVINRSIVGMVPNESIVLGFSNIQTGNTIRWSSSNTSIATVDNNGKVTSLKPGNAVITATDGVSNSTCKVAVVGELVHHDLSFTYGKLTYEVVDEVNRFIQIIPGSTPYTSITSSDLVSEVVSGGKTYTVVSIGKEAFAHCTFADTLVIPDPIVSLERWAFYQATAPAIKFSASFHSYFRNAFQDNNVMDFIVDPDNAFYSNFDLGNVTVVADKDQSSIILAPAARLKLNENGVSEVTDIVIPRQFTKIDHYAFWGCTGIKTVKMKGNVTFIGNCAFRDCRSMTNITLPESLEEIAEVGFMNCTSFTEFHVPAGVKRIGAETLEGCTGIKSITVDPNNTVYDSRNNCNAIIETETDNLIAGCQSTIVPEDVKSIGNYAFKSITTLESIYLPEGLTEIGFEAFWGCDNAKFNKIKLPSTLNTIGTNALYNCKGLTDVYASMTTPPAINNTAFSPVTYNNATLHVPVGCTNAYKTQQYWTLFNHVIDDNIEKIELSRNLAGMLPGETTHINIVSAPERKTIKWTSSNSSVATVDNNGNVTSHKVGNATITASTVENPEIIATCKVAVVGELTHHDFSFTIGKITYEVVDHVNKFVQIIAYDDKSSEITSEDLVGEVTNGGSTYTVVSIGKEAFAHCKFDNILVIPDPIVSLERMAFYQASAPAIKFSASFHSYFRNAFQDNNVREFIVDPDNAFYSNFDLGNVTVVSNKEQTSVILAPAARLKLNDNGESEVTDIVLPEQITKIDHYAFWGCTGIKTVKMLGNVTFIGNCAFRDCRSMSNITLPESLEEIDEVGFMNCTSFTEFHVPAGVKRIGAETLEGCTGIHTITVDDDNDVYDSRNNCNAIIETSIDKLIAGCMNTRVPEDVKAIGEYAFKSLTTLESIYLPEGLTEVGFESFWGCDNANFKELAIPSTVKAVGINAFYNCKGLTNVYAAMTSPNTINNTAFSPVTFQTATLHVPYGCLNKYRSTDYWNSFVNMVEGYKTSNGDVNGDGKVDIDDVNILIDIVLGRIDASIYGNKADVNNSGKVDIDDVNKTLDKVLGK